MIKIDRKYLPSKKFIYVLSIAIGVVIIAILINFIKPSISKYNSNKLNTEQEKISAAMEVDSDSDGLEDWKENLYGTDPKNKDSDNDGTSDFEEIAQNRDPLKANTAKEGQEPNDKIDPAIVEKQTKTMEEYENLSEMDKFSRNLVSNIIASQPSSGKMDTDTINSIVAKALAELPQKNYTATTKIEDLNLQTTDSSNASQKMKEYASNFYVESTKIIPILGNDLSLINSYISNNDTKSKNELIKLISKYQESVDRFIKMPVPVSIGVYDVSYHLRVINDLEKIIAIDKDIINSDSNSLGTIVALSAYNTINQDLVSVFNTIGNILKNQ